MEKKFTEEVMGKMSSTEIAAHFRKKELNGEKGWRVTATSCEYLRDHENYMCPYSYYQIAATFIKN